MFRAVASHGYIEDWDTLKKSKLNFVFLIYETSPF